MSRPDRDGETGAASQHWTGLLRETARLYEREVSGGSNPIKDHAAQVCARITRLLGAPLHHQDRRPATLPVVSLWPHTIDMARSQITSRLAGVLSRLAPSLAWLHGYKNLPPAMRERFAFSRLVGPKGHVYADDFALGLVLFAPNCTYPEHRHPNISESYIVVAGQMSQNDSGVFRPPSLLYNPPGHTHHITTGNHSPCLLLYVWIGDPADLRTSVPSLDQ